MGPKRHPYLVPTPAPRSYTRVMVPSPPISIVNPTSIAPPITSALGTHMVRLREPALATCLVTFSLVFRRVGAFPASA